jgi:hypothetical protein
MKLFLAAMRAALAVTALAAAPAFANPGTLPLKVGNPGTLPLKMNGLAQSMSGAGSVPASMVLTSATQSSLPDSAPLSCQLTGNVSKHAATGSITVASGIYNVAGICYNADTRVMEVVGQKDGNEQSFMTGALLVETPKEFSGRLTVNGPAQARYTFDVKTDDAHRLPSN